MFHPKCHVCFDAGFIRMDGLPTRCPDCAARQIKARLLIAVPITLWLILIIAQLIITAPVSP